MKESKELNSTLSPCGKFKVGDFVGDCTLTGLGIYYKILKIEGDVFWIDYNKNGVLQDHQSYHFSNYPDLRKKESFFNKAEKPESVPISLEKDDWCVKHTPELRDNLKKYSKNYWNGGSINSHYGRKNGILNCQIKSWGTVLTPEQFLEKIGAVIEKPNNVSDDLLAEARRRYPHGTKFKTANQTIGDNQIHTVDSKDEKAYTYYLGEKSMIDGGWNKGYLYYEGKWAEIVENPCTKVPIQEPAEIKIQAEVSTLRVPILSGSVTLKNTESEVKINVKQVNSIKLN